MQGQQRRAAMIEQNIGYALERAMTRDGDRGQRHEYTRKVSTEISPSTPRCRRISGITVEQFLVVVVSDGEEEKAVLPKIASIPLMIIAA